MERRKSKLYRRDERTKGLGKLKKIQKLILKSPKTQKGNV